MPTKVYYEATKREELAWRVAQRVKDVERQLLAGHLETKEIRNVVNAVLTELLEVEFDVGSDASRYRFVTEWTYIPVGEPSDLARPE